MKMLLAVVAIVVVLGAAAVGGWFWMQGEQVRSFASQPHGSGTVTVDVVAKGPLSLGELLANHGVVSDAELFAKYLRKEKRMPEMKAGEYEFELPLTPVQVADKIASGKVKVYRFTVPEGLRVDEILPILAASDLKLNIDKLERLTEDQRFLEKAGVPANRMEGFLYPDTYTFTKKEAHEEAVLTKMVGRTLEEFQKANAKRKPGVKLNLMETITLASIVEKETGAPEERPRISCVFHNRLRQNMKLQTDPTVLYAMMLIRGSFIRNITRRDLETPHPYNTYTTKGLPPGPIANPGAAAIQAALNPLDCEDLFFVSRNNGTHVFCPDLKCHEGYVDEFQRRKRGG